MCRKRPSPPHPNGKRCVAIRPDEFLSRLASLTARAAPAASFFTTRLAQGGVDVGCQTIGYTTRWPRTGRRRTVYRRLLPQRNQYMNPVPLQVDLGNAARSATHWQQTNLQPSDDSCMRAPWSDRQNDACARRRRGHTRCRHARTGSIVVTVMKYDKGVSGTGAVATAAAATGTMVLEQ